MRKDDLQFESFQSTVQVDEPARSEDMSSSDMRAQHDRLAAELRALCRQVVTLATNVSKWPDEKPVFDLERGQSKDTANSIQSAFPQLRLPDVTTSRPARRPLPDPRLVRKIIRLRRQRERFFNSELFADPAWDILLDLAAASAEHKRISVTSLCIAASVPPTTALRWIGQLVEAGLLEKTFDDRDKRRNFVALSNAGADAMANYFADLDYQQLWPI